MIRFIFTLDNVALSRIYNWLLGKDSLCMDGFCSGITDHCARETEAPSPIVYFLDSIPLASLMLMAESFPP